ncbi:MAG: hypothetical protein PHW63_03370 [Alphaproteobacteria bacterium]|nr:hypothetical protein [Alphaproteobacteria bacterium]
MVNSQDNEVATWMLQQIQEKKHLYQEMAVYHIRKLFGEQFSYTNENGNFAISKGVLSAFRKLSGDSVVWERGERMWRQRRTQDTLGRQQD